MDTKELYNENGYINWHTLANTLTDMDNLLQKMGKFEQIRYERELLINNILHSYNDFFLNINLNIKRFLAKLSCPINR